jgi:phosphoribosylformimino-5-aminoimidazole carboxamide ribotide isomerase
MATMILYPAIDLKDGQCVRVIRGDLATATVFNTSPADQARTWAAAGFSWLHVVDLDGSVSGRAINDGAIGEILASVGIPVQVGGGIRSFADVRRWIAAGVRRVILGTAAVENPDLVRAVAQCWPDQIAVSVDIRQGMAAVDGWTRDTPIGGLEIARRFEDAGVCALIVTDIDRDGAQTGFNVEVFGAFADAVAIPVIAAGGLASVNDILNLRGRSGTPIAGAILGRALYANAIDPVAALRAAGE